MPSFSPFSTINEELMEVNFRVPKFPKDDEEHLMEVFRGVDGHDVRYEKQIFDPPEWLRPLLVEPTKQPESRSIAHEARAALLDERQVCAGQTCTTTAGCQMFCCRVCGIADRIPYTKFCLL